MSVIFFEGFRDADTTWWSGDLSFSAQNAAAEFSATTPAQYISLRNIGTHTNKKVYIGVSVYYPCAQASFGADGQPFLNVYDSSNTLNLSINLAYSAVSNKSYDFVVRQNNTTIATHTFTEAPGDSQSYDSVTIYRYYQSTLFVECEFDMSVTPNTVSIRINGSTLSNGLTNTTGLTTALGSIAGFNFYWNNITNGNLSKLYVIDNIAPDPVTYLGPSMQIHRLTLPNFSVADPAEWDQSGFAGSFGPYTNVISSNDGDASRLSTTQFDKTWAAAYNDISPVAGEFAAVAGVRFKSVARKVSLDSAYKHVFYNGTSYEIGSTITLTSDNYTPNTQFINISPDSGTSWTVAELHSGSFGVKSVDPAA